MSARAADLPRIPELDGVRGCAIALVLLWHYVAEQIHAPLQSGAGRVAQVLGLTWSGVDLFFVLSGFLIAGILLDHRGAENYFRVFYVRRVCRIFPLYFLLLGLFVVMGLVKVAGDPRFRVLFEGPTPPLWSYALFVQNFFMGAQETYGAGWLGVTWSLAVEEQFYLVLPLVIFLVPPRWLPAGLLAAVLFAPILRGLTGGEMISFVGMPWRMDSLLAGALLAWGLRRPGFMEMAGRQRATLRILLLMLLAGAALLTWKKHAFGLFNHTWLAALYACFILLPLVAREGWLAAVLRWPPLCGLGRISYGVYMFHQPVSGLVHGWLRQAPPEMADARGAGITLLALGLTLVAAVLSYYLLELPIFRYGHTFRYAAAPAARPADALAPN